MSIIRLIHNLRFTSFCIYSILLFVIFIIYENILNKNITLIVQNISYLNNSKKVVYIIFGTRPEVIKLYPIIKELKKDTIYFEVKTICTYQQEEMIIDILRDFSIIPDISCNVMEKNQPLSFLSSKLFIQLESVFIKRKPDLTIVQGDTTTALIGALCSFYHKVPVAHIEAGLRTKRIYFPFPEEMNRQTISNIAKYNFCPTKISSNNLIEENKEITTIHVVGNTIIDTLKMSLKMANSNPFSITLRDMLKKYTFPQNISNIILLTIHRRENYGKPFINIMNAVSLILKNYKNITIIYPLHLNPNVLLSLKRTFPSIILYQIINHKYIKDESYSFLNRLIIVKPLSYFPLIYILNRCYFVMSDSGGLQEEAIYLKKPILVLRKTTERIEGVLANGAKLVGTNTNTIFSCAKELMINSKYYNSMTQNPYIYGEGESAKQIAKVLKSEISLKKYHYNSIAIVLTVWKRNNLNIQLQLIESQTIIKLMDTTIFIYQNSNYTNIHIELEKWKRKFKYTKIVLIQTNYDTGYYGRFLSPLTHANIKSYFILCDDDVLFGEKYFENMIRVVDSGSLATRNGRYIDSKGKEIITDNFIKGFFTWENDLEYDFGGHIWAGKIEWLKLAWQHPPPTLLNCEDAWISIVLKKYYNISTKVPKCPLPKTLPASPSLCACSDITAKSHINPVIGNISLKNNIRKVSIKILKDFYNYSGIIETNYDLYIKVRKSKKYNNNSIFVLKDNVMDIRCLYFV